jgi:hypothetical protein
MCGSTFRLEDGNLYRAFVPPSAELVARTRAVEAAMPGEGVPEAVWEAFFGPACGAIDWAYFERMFRARKAAAAYLAIQAGARRRARPASAFRCVAD